MPPVKRRYILFKIEPEIVENGSKKSSEQFSNIHEGDLVYAVRDIVQKLHGDYGLASILFNFHLKKFDHTTRTGVLAVKRESYKFVLTALPLIKTIQNQMVKVMVLKVTGTLRGSFRALQGFHGKMIYEYKKMLREREQNKVASSGNYMASSKEHITEGFRSIAKSLE